MRLLQPGNSSKLLISLLVAASFSISARAEAPPGKSAVINGATGKLYKGFSIKQSNNNQGAVTASLCPGHWSLRTALISVLVDENKDQVIAYTRQTNKYLSDTIAVGSKRFKNFHKAGDFEWGPYKVVGKDKYLGENVVVLERKGRRTDLAVKNDVVIFERELACPRIKFSKNFQVVALSLFDVDFDHGFPLKVQRMAWSSNPRMRTVHPVLVMDTVSMRETVFPASDFELPKGLTRVKTEIDLFNADMDMDNVVGRSNNGFLRVRDKSYTMDPKR